MKERFTFDLVSEPWLPCTLLDGSRAHLSVEAALIRADEIAELGDRSPVVTAALHRLLLAIIHRIFGPRDVDAWTELWRQRRLPREPILEYLHRWRARFDLFDSKRPFYQVAELEDEGATTINKLAHDRASGNNPTLFDHSVDSSPPFVDPAYAARLLVAHQGFALGGLVSYRDGEDPRQFKSADAAPLVKCAVVLVRGANLFETLLMNLVQHDPDREIPFAATCPDIPAWESERQPSGADREPDGYLDFLTWQSRRVRLIPSQGDGRVVVRQVVNMKGDQFPNAPITLRRCETMAAFRKIDKPTAGGAPWLPVGLRMERLAWRDSDALFELIPGKTSRPKTLEWSAEVTDRAGQNLYSLEIIGLIADRAKLVAWRREWLPLPVSILIDEWAREAVHSALQHSEDMGRALRAGLEALAARLLNPRDAMDQRAPPKDQINALVESLGVESRYWAALEQPFNQFLDVLPVDGEAAVNHWRDDVRVAAKSVLDEIYRSMDGSARALRAQVACAREFANRASWRAEVRA